MLSFNDVTHRPDDNPALFDKAWQQSQAQESRKAFAKQETEIYSRWKRLITSALLHERLVEAYGDSGT